MSDNRDQTANQITPDDLARWERVRQRLRAELGDAVYNSWFTRLELDRIENQNFHLTVPTKFLKSWVQSHYAPRIKSRVAAEFKAIDHVLIDVRSTARKAKARPNETGHETDAASSGAVAKIASIAATVSDTAAAAGTGPLSPASGGTATPRRACQGGVVVWSSGSKFKCKYARAKLVRVASGLATYSSGVVAR